MGAGNVPFVEVLQYDAKSTGDAMENVPSGYPATLEIDYPDRQLDRLAYALLLATDRYPPFSLRS
jgi:hypothetical protein